MTKPKNSHTRFTLRVPCKVKTALEKKAKAEGRSINAQTVQILQEGLKRSAAA